MSLKPVNKRETPQNLGYNACTRCFTGLRTAVRSKAHDQSKATVNFFPGWTSWRAERRRSRCSDPALINSVKSRGVHATSQTSCVCQTNLLHAGAETQQNLVQHRSIAITSSHEAGLNWVCAFETLGEDSVRRYFLIVRHFCFSAYLRFHRGNMATPAAVNPSGE